MLVLLKKLMVTLLILFISILHAKTIDISKIDTYSLLEHSKVYFSEGDFSLQEVIQSKQFKPYSSPYINIGTSTKTIWISLELSNTSNHSIDKILVLNSPVLEHITLYNQQNINKIKIKGMYNLTPEHTTLSPFFKLSLAANSSNIFWLEIKSITNPIDFSIIISNYESYYSEDREQQFIYTILIGILIALILHSFLQFVYIRDKSYLFYGFYLFSLIYQQITYLGLSQIYFPSYVMSHPMQTSIFKVTLLLITASLYSMHFLKAKEIPHIYKGYMLFFFLGIIEMTILNIPSLYNLDIVILTVTLFMVYNLYAGYISYIYGNKQARLFIVGFTTVCIAYTFMALDALGITSIMQEFKYLLMILTTLEALILSLAFTDRYTILQKEKEETDALLLKNSKNRTKIIEKKVEQKTQELKTMIETKELLIKEIHHRVKNNLQIILSMIRMQNDHIETIHDKMHFLSLENRINAIAKTYDMLIINENLEEIDLGEYIDALLGDIISSYHNKDHHIEIVTDISAIIPLRESIYIGLLLNEMVTNTYKYAFANDGIIEISLRKQDNMYILKYRDNGKGYKSNKKHDSLGLKLIHQLVYHQLNGSMEIDSVNHTKYTIRFTL